MPTAVSSLRHNLRELWELGLERSVFRAAWEARTALGLWSVAGAQQPHVGMPEVAAFFDAIPFANPAVVSRLLRDLVAEDAGCQLLAEAREAGKGRIVCFSRSTADFGNPVNWHLNPSTGRSWPSDAPWYRAAKAGNGDIKLTWEIARFPQAYTMARAAVLAPDARQELSDLFAGQVHDFVRANPVGLGVHWHSGQEVAFRMMAWLFAAHVFRSLGCLDDATGRLIQASLREAAGHVDSHISFAEKAVYNNHLLSEACLLLIAGKLLGCPSWSARGTDLLTRGVQSQFSSDGAYIQNSHNYHRLAVQVLLWAVAFSAGVPSESKDTWLLAIDRSVGFLFAHQEPESGWLPNYGANDGALPAVLSTCAYPDFRPTLQAAGVVARARRLYEPGPWDEESLWLWGATAFDGTVTPPPAKSVSFPASGYHVLRGAAAGSFAAFRCGSVTDRFSQIDMLHLDVWWRGQNVLADPGSYLYNAEPEWHNYAFRTAAHNTVQLDGLDQMLHFRRFKCLYWTTGRIARFDDAGSWVLVEGEHYGYRRHQGACVHSRSVLYVKDDTWVVLDTIHGSGSRDARLHWLCGPYPYRYDAPTAELTLATGKGAFTIQVRDLQGSPIALDVNCGSEHPPRGWISRYYGHREPAPSIAVVKSGPVPISLVTVLSGARASVSTDRDTWRIDTPAGPVGFRIDSGQIRDVDVHLT